MQSYLSRGADCGLGRSWNALFPRGRAFGEAGHLPGGVAGLGGLCPQTQQAEWGFTACQLRGRQCLFLLHKL